METWRTTEAGRHFQTLLEGVRRGKWQLVREHGRADVVLADAEEIENLLGAGFRFRPMTTFDGQRVDIWLPEVETHVAAATLEDARRGLSESMISYAAEWEQHGRQTAEQSLKAGYVRRIQLAGDEKGVLAMLDRDAQLDRANGSPSPALGSPGPAGIHISLMSQYHPTQNVKNHNVLNRSLYKQEYESIVKEMEVLGFRNGWVQDMESFENYRPDFSKENPFE